MSFSRESWVPSFFLWLGLAVCAAAVFHLWPDRAYYFLTPAQRALHPHHAMLRSSGSAGLTFGAIGAGLLFINLTYLIRKALINIRWLGTLRSWMAFHVFTGLVAGAMVLLHSTFLLRSALGTVALVAMVVVLLTGLIGRYIYSHTPRSLKGRELEIEEIRKNLAAYQTALESMGMPKEFFGTGAATSTTTRPNRGMAATFLGMLAGDKTLRREQRRLRSLVKGHATLRSSADRILPLAKRYVQERQWLARYAELRSLMGNWRFFHRWFAIALLAAVAFHMLIAFSMGHLKLGNSFKTFFDSFR